MIFSTQEFVTIYAAYSEPYRKYHNFNHVMSMFLLAKDQNIKLTPIQECAILLHDVVYSIGNDQDNELLSAEYARDILDKYKSYTEMQGFNIERVELCILSTKHHRPLCNDADIVIDLDLSCLVYNYETYRKEIYEEFLQLFSEEAFCAGRSAFLDHMIKRDKIFYTKTFGVFEDVAKNNMKAELEYLQNRMKELNNK